MEDRSLTRRRFLGVIAASAAMARSSLTGAESPGKPRDRKTILSFYCDDTNPHTAGA
jgi:hypothetical protein